MYLQKYFTFTTTKSRIKANVKRTLNLDHRCLEVKRLICTCLCTHGARNHSVSLNSRLPVDRLHVCKVNGLKTIYLHAEEAEYLVTPDICRQSTHSRNLQPYLKVHSLNSQQNHFHPNSAWFIHVTERI